jgi:hypothetical protein
MLDVGSPDVQKSSDVLDVCWLVVPAEEEQKVFLYIFHHLIIWSSGHLCMSECLTTVSVSTPVS